MKKLILMVFMASIFVSCKNDEKIDNSISIGDFSFSSKEIAQNEPFTITYNGSGELEESFYHKIQNSKVLPDDLVFTDNKAIITVPDSITAVAFNIKVDGDFDNNNKKGYLFNVTDKDGNKVADSDASLNYYSMTYGQEFELDSDAKEALSSIESAIKTNPNLTEDWFGSHIYVANQVSGTTGKTVGQKYISEYTSKPEMELKDYETLSSIYYSMRNNEKGDSIVNIAAEKFPDSDLAFRLKANEFFDAKRLEDKEKIFKSHQAKMLKSRNASYMLRVLAMEHYKNGNMDAFNEYVTLMEKNTDKASLYNSIAWPNAEKGEDLESSAKLSLQSLKLVEAEQKDLKEKPDYYSPNQYKNSLVGSYNMYADTYALLSFKNGNIKDAIEYQSKAVSKNSNPEMNERYVQFLMADNQFDKAKEQATKFIEEGQSTAKLKVYFKEAFTKSGDNGNPETILADLEAKAKQKELDDLRKTLLDEDAIDFTLKNLDGEEVTLSALKGKTVVLDFWATWCGPCIASFPGMQKVVDKYKDNENVAFFFVDTFEDGETRLKDVAKFIEDNNYDFNVLIDPKEENGSKHIVANDYKITGIPTKIIIGPSGKVNFKSVGYSGSAEKIVSEIDAMVELLKTNP